MHLNFDKGQSRAFNCTPQTALCRRLDGHWSRSGFYEEGEIPAPSRNRALIPWSGPQPSHCTDLAVCTTNK
jgi:hypothetical protein